MQHPVDALNIHRKSRLKKVTGGLIHENNLPCSYSYLVHRNNTLKATIHRALYEYEATFERTQDLITLVHGTSTEEVKQPTVR